MNVICRFDIGADIIALPECSNETLKDHQNKFFVWLQEGEHDYLEDGVLIYRADAFVEYLNKCVYENEVSLIQEGLDIYHSDLPILYF